MIRANKTSAAVRASNNRRDNLLRFVRKSWGTKSEDARNAFKLALKEKLLADPRYRREAEANRAAISRTLSSRTAQPLSSEKALLIETLFDLEPEFLSRERPKKSPAYVLLQCRADAAEKLADALTAVRIVDEVAVVVGDADLFIRLFGTQEEIKTFLLRGIFDLAGQLDDSESLSASISLIDRTKTYLAFEDTYYLRHHPKNNSDFHEQ